MAKTDTTPRKDNSGTPGKKVRTSMYIDPEKLEKIQYISFMDSKFDSQTQFMDEAFDEKIAAWEKKNGPAVKK